MQAARPPARAPEPEPASWHGRLELTYERRGDTTRVLHDRAVAPLKIQRPFYPEGPEICHSVLLHTAGGVVGGDRLSVAIDLGPRARALLTAAAATKIYRTNGRPARQTVRLRVGEDACAEWLPPAAIAFEGAWFRQDLRVELAPGATWWGWELTRLGRSARGERFCAGDWKAAAEVWQDGEPLWVDRQWIPGSEAVWDSLHGPHGQPVLAAAAYLGRPVDRETVAAARSLWEPFGVASPAQTGVTRLDRGLLCRYRGPSTGEARAWFWQVWNRLRPDYLQRPAIWPRVWG